MVKFNSKDIVVWSGIITRFDVIKMIIDENDLVRLATKEEISNYQQYN